MEGIGQGRLIIMIKPGTIIRHVKYPEMRLRVLAYDNPKILCECIVPARDWELWDTPGKLYEWVINLSVWMIVPKPHKSHLPEWL